MKLTNAVTLNMLNPLTAKLINLNFHPPEVVSRWRDPQLQVSENYADLTKWRSTRIYAAPAVKRLKRWNICIQNICFIIAYYIFLLHHLNAYVMVVRQLYFLILSVRVSTWRPILTSKIDPRTGREKRKMSASTVWKYTGILPSETTRRTQDSLMLC